jgi:transcriptional regulator with XRE-family HTH domain
LRKVRELTQEHLAKELNIKQESISKLEKRSDMMLSTLRKYITALGGELTLVVSLPGKPPYALKSFEAFSAAEIDDKEDIKI